MATNTSNQSLTLPGNTTGCLLSHGFTSSPQSVSEWAHAVHAAGFSVSAPCLPGHGTSWRDLNTTRWPQWFAQIHQSATELRKTCDTLIVGGQSLGGALVLRLAQEFPDLVDGIVLVNPAVRLDDPRLKLLPVLKRIIPAVPGIAGDIKRDNVNEYAYPVTPLRALHSMTDLFYEVRRDLPRITCPVHLYRSTNDHVVPASSSAQILQDISSGDTTETLLTNSYHVATMDNDRETIFRGTVDFVSRIAQNVTNTPSGEPRP